MKPITIPYEEYLSLLKFGEERFEKESERLIKYSRNLERVESRINYEKDEFQKDAMLWRSQKEERIRLLRELEQIKKKNRFLFWLFGIDFS